MAVATPEDRAELAKRAKTSEAYLFNQLGNGHRENPKLRFALDIVKASAIMARRTARSRRVPLPEITLEGLAWPTM